MCDTYSSDSTLVERDSTNGAGESETEIFGESGELVDCESSDA